MAAGGLVENLTSANSPYTMLAGDEAIMANAASGVIAITLLSPVTYKGYQLTVFKTDSSTNAITLTTPAGIIGSPSGTSTYTLTTLLPCVTLVADGTNWQVQPTSTSGGGSNQFTIGTYSAIPAASSLSGEFYYATDLAVVFYSNGTTWTPINVAPGTARRNYRACSSLHMRRQRRRR